MAGYKRYRKDSPVSYALGITLTFELLRFQPDKVTRVYIHSGMKEGETLDKLRSLCRDAGIEMVQTDSRIVSKRKLLRDRRIYEI